MDPNGQMSFSLRKKIFVTESKLFHNCIKIYLTTWIKKNKLGKKENQILFQGGGEIDEKECDWFFDFSRPGFACDLYQL
ncbi:MAG: hypothetical protein KAW02_05850 [candidate division Zixibacteria bacterium]|nr:hypothetical protein [candidate division Zixibacteria bacterium]